MDVLLRTGRAPGIRSALPGQWRQRRLTMGKISARGAIAEVQRIFGCRLPKQGGSLPFLADAYYDMMDQVVTEDRTGRDGRQFRIKFLE